jgi:hypothetical protein
MKKTILAAIVLAVSTHEASAIVLNQVDDFQDGTTMGWGGGGISSNAPTGGPGGAGDRYLAVITNGGTVGPGTRLGTTNGLQWGGDYLAAGVAAVEADLRNFSGVTVEMRVLIQGAGGDFTSTVAISVPDDGLWHQVRFDIGPGDLTAVGGFNVAATLAGVSNVILRHQPGAPAGVGGAPALTTGSLGADNIAARSVPLPSLSGWALLALVSLIVASATMVIARHRGFSIRSRGLAS